ncbi:MAG: hypothetical protein HC904_15255 [Blastochloris sp.]|nr:hypothetical protein [Blastochloris sp.]
MFLTLLCGGELYRSSLFQTAGTARFDLGTGWLNLKAALLRSLPLLLLLPLLVRVRWNITPQSPLPTLLLPLGLCGLLSSLPLSLLTASKLGAGYYYYMTPALYAGILCVGLLIQFPRNFLLWPALTCALILQGGVLAGFWGQVNLSGQSRLLAFQWQHFQSLPEPRYSSNFSLNLPWLNPNSPPIIPAFTYSDLRNQHIPLEGDGLAGIVRRKDWKSLYLHDSGGPWLDGVNVINFYEPLHSNHGMTSYQRRENNPDP